MLSRASTPRKIAPASPLSTSRSRVKVRAGDKWLLMGASGSGKTTAAKMLDAQLELLYPTARHYILDSKHDGDFDEYPGKVAGDLCPRRPGRNQRYQVWQPVRELPEEIEKWLWMVRHDPPAILLIDELYTLVYRAGQYSDEFNIILKTGRSLPIGVITLSQELSRIPPNAYKQATHRLGFYIDEAAEYDRRLVRKLLKAPKKLEDPEDDFGFFYQHINRRTEPMYFPSVQEFLGLS